MSISYVGTWMQRLTQDWMALVVLGGGAHAVGLATSLQLLPYVLLSLTAGRIADRVRTPWVVLLGNLGGLIISMVLAALAASGVLTLPALYVLAFSLGIVTALESPSRTRLLSDLVPQKAIPSSVSWRNTSYEGAHLLGLPLAGVLLAGIGPGWVCALNAASYCPMVLEGWRLRHTEAARPNPSPTSTQVRAALSYVLQSRTLGNVLLVVLAVSLFVANFNVLVSALVVQRFDGGSTLAGWMAAMPAAGAVLGSTITARPKVVRVAWTVAAAVAGSVAVAALAWTSSLVATGAVLILIGLATALVTNVSNALLLGSPQTDLRGRIAAITKMVTMCGTAAGSYVAGLFADCWGLDTAFLLLGSGTLLVLALHAVTYKTGLTPGSRPIVG